MKAIVHEKYRPRMFFISIPTDRMATIPMVVQG